MNVDQITQICNIMQAYAGLGLRRPTCSTCSKLSLCFLEGKKMEHNAVLVMRLNMSTVAETLNIVLQIKDQHQHARLFAAGTKQLGRA